MKTVISIFMLLAAFLSLPSSAQAQHEYKEILSPEEERESGRIVSIIYGAQFMQIACGKKMPEEADAFKGAHNKWVEEHRPFLNKAIDYFSELGKAKSEYDQEHHEAFKNWFLSISFQSVMNELEADGQEQVGAICLKYPAYLKTESMNVTALYSKRIDELDSKLIIAMKGGE